MENIIAKMEDDKQIARVPYDPSLPVSTAWDLGVSDHTAIIFFQQLGRAVNIIDYYEERGQGLPHYVQVIKIKITSTKITLHHTTSKLQIFQTAKRDERLPTNLVCGSRLCQKSHLRMVSTQLP